MAERLRLGFVYWTLTQRELDILVEVRHTLRRTRAFVDEILNEGVKPQEAIDVRALDRQIALLDRLLRSTGVVPDVSGIARVVCVRCRDLPRPDWPVARVRCSECRAEVWASSASMQMVRRGFQPTCHQCAATVALALDAPPLVGMTVDQRREYDARRERFAEEQGVRADQVVGVLPAELSLALQLSGRRN